MRVISPGNGSFYRNLL